MKNKLLKGLCVGALVCLSPVMLFGCAKESDLTVLEDKISQLEQKIENLQTPTNPENPVESELISINSKEDAYNVVWSARERSLFNEDGSAKNVSMSFKYKMSNSLDWIDAGLVYYGTFDNGVSYMYQRMSWDNGYTDSLVYEKNSGVYSFNASFSESALNFEVRKSQIEDSCLKDYTFRDADSNLNVLSYKILENGNYEIVIDSIYAQTDDHYGTTTFKKVISTCVVNAQGLMISNTDITYSSVLTHSTGEQTAYTKTEESITEITYNVETPVKVFEMFALSEDTELASN